MENTAQYREVATFAAGCFWGVEETFLQTPGVLSTRVGYTGGTTEHPRYQDVCTGATGHAEAVEVTFDPARVSYENLLKIFWENHNPTTVDRQGPDIGSQYRSAIFFHGEEQRQQAEVSKATLEQSGKWKKPIVTQIVLALPFYEAEEYHQQYLRKRGLPSCHT
ncbi:peptide-methionine (S)-S-oxide reductase MsrA [Candidatus Peregrinibacteria bacterium]|nr:peptide-methionine (S)-S-oxide reductase MsrA [Candidatus Peregrinibacteria bacterium]MBI3816719.1 peptide-methionine (S)-S-oxide reductase MsrA [Candidatus Peregrinibacteria bacterium]